MINQYNRFFPNCDEMIDTFHDTIEDMKLFFVKRHDYVKECMVVDMLC